MGEKWEGGEWMNDQPTRILFHDARERERYVTDGQATLSNAMQRQASSIIKTWRICVLHIDISPRVNSTTKWMNSYQSFRPTALGRCYFSWIFLLRDMKEEYKRIEIDDRVIVFYQSFPFLCLVFLLWDSCTFPGDCLSPMVRLSQQEKKNRQRRKSGVGAGTNLFSPLFLFHRHSLMSHVQWFFVSIFPLRTDSLLLH